MKRKFGIVGFIVSLILILFPASLGAVTYNQYVSMVISNNNTSGFTYLPVIVNINNSQLASYGYIAATGLNTNIEEGGSSSSYSLITNKAVIVIPTLSGNQQRTYQYQLGATPAQTDLPFSSGYGGNISILDSASLELGNSFEINTSGYVNTSAGADKNIVYKDGAFQLYVSAAGTITAKIPGTGSTIDQSHVAGTLLVQSAYTVNRAGQSFTPAASGYLSTVEVYLTKQGSPTGNMTLNLYLSDANNKPTGSILATSGVLDSAAISGTYQAFTFGTPAVITSGTKYVFVLVYSGGDGANYVVVRGNTSDSYAGGKLIISADSGATWTEQTKDIDFKTYVTPVAIINAAGQSSGEHNYKVTLSGGTMTLYDGVTSLGTAAFGSSVPDNGNNWMVGQNDVMPYIDYYKHSVSSVLKAWYQPVNLIIVNVLADRSGNANTGTINFGTNPASITITIGGITPSTSYVASSSTGEGDPADVMYSPGIVGFENTSATGSNLPYYAIFDRAGEAMGISTLTVYGMMILFIALVVFVAVAISTSSQMMGLMGAGMVTGVGAAAIIGVWVVFIVAVGGGMLLYVYRRT
jgi:hypothetical protein